jgi:hypothetical protein
MKTPLKDVEINKTRTAQTTAVVSLAAGLLLFAPNVAFSQPPPPPPPAKVCAVNWNDRLAVGLMYNQAADTFVVPTRLVNGKHVASRTLERSPTSAQTDTSRWEYRQLCGPGVISVWDQYAGHFHLMFKDPAIGACFASSVINGETINGFGRNINGKCVAPDWQGEPRVAFSMGGGTWWEILNLDFFSAFGNGGQGITRAFDLNSISVGGTVPIQLWFKKADGSVWGFSRLSPGVNWNVEGSASGIVAAWVGPELGDNSPFVINGLSVTAY